MKKIQLMCQGMEVNKERKKKLFCNCFNFFESSDFAGWNHLSKGYDMSNKKKNLTAGDKQSCPCHFDWKL